MKASWLVPFLFTWVCYAQQQQPKVDSSVPQSERQGSSAALQSEGQRIATLLANSAPNTLVLWPDGAPGALGTSSNDTPIVTAFFPKPELATGAAVVICPGGGYAGLAAHEGADYARWLNEQGIAGFVLRYRLGSTGYRHPAMMDDAARAIRFVRSKASEWKLDPKRIGIMGSSAGGHLASTMLTHFDSGKVDAVDPVERQSSRPDLAILCYPVISMESKWTHVGSRKNLLGTNQPPELLHELSAEAQVSSQTPPTFVWHTADDPVVPVENSLELGAALRRVGVPFELHVYQTGPHGLGLGSRQYDPSKRHPWTADCKSWLKLQGFGR